MMLLPRPQSWSLETSTEGTLEPTRREIDEALRAEGLSAAFFESVWPLRNVRFGAVLRALDWRHRVVGVLAAAEGRVVFKASRRGVPGSDPNPGFALDFLAARGYEHSPKIVPSREGARFARAGAWDVVVMEHVEGPVPGRTPRHHRALAAALADLHTIRDYPLPWLITVTAVRPFFDDIAGRLERPSDRQRLVDIASALPDFDGLPRALVHGEMNLDNCLRRPDGRLVAVDWDSAGTGPRVFDVGCPLITWFVSEDLRFDIEGASAFYREYFSRIRPTNDELAALFDVAVFAAIRAIEWANPEARWRRLQWAIENRATLMSVVEQERSS